MNHYILTGKNIDDYKLFSVKEHPLDSNQQYLDCLCFPTLSNKMLWKISYMFCEIDIQWVHIELWFKIS